MILFLGDVFFPPKLKVCRKKNKILYLQKLENLLKNLFRQRRFHIFKKHLFKSWRAENMPLLADNLDYYFLI